MPTIHVIPPTISAEGVENRLEAFNQALVAMRDAHLHDQTFILSDGTRDLIIASPGGLLLISDQRGELIVADEQDFQRLIRSIW